MFSVVCSLCVQLWQHNLHTYVAIHVLYIYTDTHTHKSLDLESDERYCERTQSPEHQHEFILWTVRILRNTSSPEHRHRLHLVTPSWSDDSGRIPTIPAAAGHVTVRQHPASPSPWAAPGAAAARLTVRRVRHIGMQTVLVHNGRPTELRQLQYHQRHEIRLLEGKRRPERLRVGSRRGGHQRRLAEHGRQC